MSKRNNGLRPEDAFAAALNEGKLRMRWSRGAVAHHVGATIRSVSRWSVGERLPHPIFHERILIAFAPAGRDVTDRMFVAFGLPPPPPPAPVVAPPRDVASLRRDVELAFFTTVEQADLPPRKARGAIVQLLSALERLGVSIADAKAWLAPPSSPTTR